MRASARGDDPVVQQASGTSSDGGIDVATRSVEINDVVRQDGKRMNMSTLPGIAKNCRAKRNAFVGAVGSGLLGAALLIGATLIRSHLSPKARLC